MMDKKSIFQTIIKTTKIVAPIIAVESIYHKMFDHRFYSPKFFSFADSDFPNLIKEKQTFKSNEGNTLKGYIYRQKSAQIQGIFVFSHGYGGGGHHCYLDLINAVTEEGFLVFAYDATANDESEGKSIHGFTQGMLDADKAISHIESLKKYKDLPLYLMGHSWGAYSVSNALDYHPRVKGLISLSGFNMSTSIFEANGELYAGDSSKEFYEKIHAHEMDLFKELANHTAIDSFRSSKARICIIHAENDKTVPISAGYDKYYQEFKNDKRFKFIHYIARGHATIYYTNEGRRYVERINKTYEKYIKANKPTEQQKEDFLKGLIDRKIYCSLVDKKLIKEAIKFIK